MIHLAFLWHMHQPYYRDLGSGTIHLPWVRMHGTKDYFGMAAMLKERPPIRATINWVPCLVEQIETAASGASPDNSLKICLKDADSLEEDDIHFMLKNFFRANRERMIFPWPRYRELLEKRGDDLADMNRVAERFSTGELRDLQVWVNLAWFHRTLQKSDPTLVSLIRKGSGFTEKDKQALLDLQKNVLGRVLGMYKELQDRGQIEITTSPYYHPILPLLLEMDSARVAMPDAPMPSMRGPWNDDARRHMELAVESHKRVFGRAPAGMWPSEGSVSPKIAALAAQFGIKWIATDEGILSRSLGIDLNNRGPNEPDTRSFLYRPYRFGEPGADVTMVFRDREMSDLIGFKYQHMGARAAASDFIDRLRAKQTPNRGDLLVPVILDGENPWEGYPEGGIEFLDVLYSRLAEADDIRTTTISGYLEGVSEVPRLERLHPGSWIDSNFSVWIGCKEDNLAWDHIGRTADFFRSREAKAAPEARRLAHDCLLAAQGSDWFWWYGDRFSSEEDEYFDGLFRTHLMNVYSALGEQHPEDLEIPILKMSRKPYSRPVGLLEVYVDGANTYYFEWSGAGSYDPSRDYTSMGRSAEATVTQIMFGFNLAELYLRVDLFPEARKFLQDGGDVRLNFRSPSRRFTLKRGARPFAGDLLPVLPAKEAYMAEPLGAWAAGKILEISIPFAKLGVGAREMLRFQVEAVQRGRVLDKFPRGGVFEIEVPDEGFEAENWIA